MEVGGLGVVDVVTMKIISWNVRGLGSFKKRREVRQLVREKNPFILCIQETKLAIIDDFVCKAIWGDDCVGYSFRPSLGASGGLVTLWDSNKVDVWSTISFDHVLVIVGRFFKFDELSVVFNVYASCDVSRQQALWVNISNRLISFASQNICVCGDFNAVWCGSERRSVGNSTCQVGMAAFNFFIDSNLLIDLPLRGRNFTWFQGDGKSMSRINCFLLSDNWCLTWPSCSQLASTRGLSDHCPLVLFVDEENWGPRPLRMLKCWESFPGYRIFVEEKWRSFDVDGWGGFVLKEKFKLMKMALKYWHQQHSQNLPAKIVALKDKITILDLKGETMVLLDGEVEEMHGLTEELFYLSRINNSICWQESRALWLQEGDANSKKKSWDYVWKKAR